MAYMNTFSILYLTIRFLARDFSCVIVDERRSLSQLSRMKTKRTLLRYSLSTKELDYELEISIA